ncbi:DUF4436 family protein [Subtercola sp. RTI3]|uniref:DUF4436 family protein n=1 Tax=Subtercola sp. RTI3 TaxID=3048639 RepID=UPI002B23B485|nr:DUF4436 family protein [Subtercola sp. RTI3]MEA9986438.1 DUF4436 family protein [Subtercola sp. RTI3]
MSINDTQDSPPLSPVPPTQKALALWRRRSARLVAVIAVVVIVYAVVVTLYAASGRIANDADVTPNPGGVTVVLTPKTINPLTETISMELELTPSTEIEANDSITLDQAVTLVLSPVSGSQTMQFAKDAIPGTQPVTSFAPGAVEQWPIDTYRSEIFIQAYAEKNGVLEPIDTKVIYKGYMPGWSLSADRVTHGEMIQTAEGLKPAYFAQLTASRSGSTFAFGFLLLALMVVLPILQLFVAISVFRGFRKVEPSFLSWMGAMLFAIIPLRSFLPGAPPVGSWIDFVVVLWVIVALISGIVVYVIAWMRWGSPAAPIIEPPPATTPAPAPTHTPPG